jgi:hypothetical protein
VLGQLIADLTGTSFTQAEPQVFTLQSAGGLWSTGPDLVRFGTGWRTLLLALNAELVRSAT